MRFAQVIVYENDGKLAESLRPLSKERGFWLREVRHNDACLNALRRSGTAILILKVGRDLEREMDLLHQAAFLFPEAVALVVGESDHPGLSGLAWDLGARFVVFRQESLELISDIVSHLIPVGGNPQQT